MNRIATLSLLAACLGILGGCETTEKITRRSELEKTDRSNPLSLITKDSLSYVLKTYSLTDSTIAGSGFRMEDTMRVPFDGSLPLSSISYMQITRGSGFKTVIAIAAIAVVGFTAGSYLSGSEAPMIVRDAVTYYNPHYQPSGGTGGSCPFVHSWDGNRYTLEGEAYAVAWGKALEMTTSTVLPSVRPDHGEVKVRISNERPETHYTNSVRLKAAQVERGAYAVSDADLSLWTIAKPLAPFRAIDKTGKDIAASVGARDNVFWESNFSDISPASEFEDVIELTFPKPSGQASGTLVVRAVNSDMFDVVLRNISEMVGEESLEFVRALETDRELIALMRRWRDEASIKVHVWNGHAWDLAGCIVPEANVVPFSKAVRIRSGGTTGDCVRIRLSCLADVWKVDAVQVDWTPAQSLQRVGVPLLTASGPGDRDVGALLSHDDESYVTTLPPDKIDLRFRAVDPLPGKQVVYVLEVRGYLHEWMPAAHPSGSRKGFAGAAGSGRISVLKSLLQLRNVILPPIYAEWMATKHRIPTSK